MRILVTGMADEEMVYAALDLIHAFTKITTITETGGPHAELWARFWAEDNGVAVDTVRDETPVKTAIEAFKPKPDYVLAFPFYSMALIRRAEMRGVQIGFAEIRDQVVEGGIRAPGRDEEVEIPMEGVREGDWQV